MQTCPLCKKPRFRDRSTLADTDDGCQRINNSFSKRLVRHIKFEIGLEYHLVSDPCMKSAILTLV